MGQQAKCVGMPGNMSRAGRRKKSTVQPRAAAYTNAEKRVVRDIVRHVVQHAACRKEDKRRRRIEGCKNR